MPIVNLIVAQAAAAWIAAPNLVSLVFAQGPVYDYIVAVAMAIVVLIGAFIGSRLAKSIPQPTLISSFTTVAFAIIAAYAVTNFFGPTVLSSELQTQAMTFMPLAATVMGYFVTSDRPAG